MIIILAFDLLKQVIIIKNLQDIKELKNDF